MRKTSKQKNVELLAIGDTTTDTFLDINDATVVCDRNDQHCKLCITYADKVPVKAIHRVPASGNAANVAIGARRLGIHTAIWTLLGDDVHGQEALQVFQDEDVNTQHVKKVKKAHTNASTLLVFQGERTILSFHDSRTYTIPRGLTAPWVYYTSVGANHEQLNVYVKQLAKRGVHVAYNPGSQQMLAGVDSVRSIVSIAEIVFVNKEEAWRILGYDSVPERAAEELVRMGAKKAVVTDAGKGAWAHDGTNRYFEPSFTSHVVETTGAGDAYATGVVSALLQGESFASALRWGAVNSASVLQYVGSREGLLSTTQLKKYMRLGKLI